MMCDAHHITTQFVRFATPNEPKRKNFFRFSNAPTGRWKAYVDATLQLRPQLRPSSPQGSRCWPSSVTALHFDNFNGGSPARSEVEPLVLGTSLGTVDGSPRAGGGPLA